MGKRILITTLIALSSGLFGAYLGGQTSTIARTQQCDAGAKQVLPLEGLLKPVCQAVVTPGALWQGSTTGLWTGMILGAFIAGLATRKSPDKEF